MRDKETNVSTQQVTTTATRTVDCFRKITDKETGVTEVKRWVDERSIGANLMLVDKGKGGVFHNGARIA